MCCCYVLNFRLGDENRKRRPGERARKTSVNGVYRERESYKGSEFEECGDELIAWNL